MVIFSLETCYGYNVTFTLCSSYSQLLCEFDCEMSFEGRSSIHGLKSKL